MEKALRVKRLWLSGSPGKTRTCNLLVNSQTLLPIELPGSAYNSVSNFKEQRNQLPGLSLQPIPLQRERYPALAGLPIVYSVSNFKEQRNQLPGLSLQPIPLQRERYPALAGLPGSTYQITYISIEHTNVISCLRSVPPRA